MKGKRSRNAQKTLLFYKIHFGLEPPYRLLIDGTICNTAYANHINLAEQVPKLFQAEVKIFTTNCAISEVEGLQARFGVSRGTSLTILKQFPVIPCHHDRMGDVASCFASKYKNNLDVKSDKNKFCIGTLDQNLREQARSSAGVPVFILKSKVPHLEPPSEKSHQIAKQITENRTLTEHQRTMIAGIKRSVASDDESNSPEKKKRKKPQAPNPLSCLKKKSKAQPEKTGGRKSRKRKPAKKEEDLMTLIKKVT